MPSGQRAGRLAPTWLTMSAVLAVASLHSAHAALVPAAPSARTALLAHADVPTLVCMLACHLSAPAERTEP